MDSPKTVNILIQEFLRIKMLTVFGVSTVLYFDKLLSGNRNF